MNRETVVVAAGLWSRLLLLPLVLLAAAALLVFAVAMFFVYPWSLLVRLALWLLAIAFAVLAGFMLLLGLSLFTRIEVGMERVRVRVPQWRGPIPWLPWIRAEIPFSDIKAVERRDEFYRSFGLPSMQTAYSIEEASLEEANGRRIVLGYATAMKLPFDEAAKLIAERAGLHFVERGGVKVGGIVRAMVHGTPSWDTPSISEEERRTTQAKAVRAFSLVFALMTALIALKACLQSH